MIKEWFSRRVPSLPFLALLAAAGAVRLAVLLEHSRHPLFSFLRLDEIVYDEWAKSVAAGEYFGDYLSNHAPGYPWVLGVAYRVFGYHPVVPRFLQMAADICSAGIIFLCARRLFDRPSALVSAGLFAFYWPLLVFEQRLLAEPLFLFFVLLSFFLGIRAVGRGKFLGWFPAGLAGGAALLVRPTAFFWLALVFFWLVLQGPRRGMQNFLSVPAFLAGAALLSFPVLFHNHRISGQWMLQSNAGLNLYLGNNPDADGTPYARPGSKWDEVQARPYLERKTVDPAAQDRFYFEAVGDFLRSSPRRFLALTVRKTGLLFNRVEIRATIDPQFHRRLFRGLSFPWPGFGVILALALPGFFSLSFSRKEHQLLVLFSASFGLVVVLTVVAGRYRLPFAAGLIFFSGAGLMSLIRSGRQWLRPGVTGSARSGRRALILFGLCLAGMVVSLLPLAPRYSEAEELSYLGDAFFQAGNQAVARRSYMEALAVDAKHAAAMIGMSRLSMTGGDWGSAMEWLRKAKAAEPGSSRVHFFLGLLLEKQGRKEEARAELAEAVSMRPLWVSGLFQLSRLEAETGKTEEALAHLELILALRPSHEAARELLRQLRAGPS